MQKATSCRKVLIVLGATDIRILHRLISSRKRPCSTTPAMAGKDRHIRHGGRHHHHSRVATLTRIFWSMSESEEMFGHAELFWGSCCIFPRFGVWAHA